MITIGIPVYRRTDFIDQALKSCLEQTFRDFEIIVLDSSPSDDLREKIEQYPDERIRYHRVSPATGITKKLNMLVQMAGTPWMMILCDDDYLEPGFLEAMAGRIRENPDATLFRCRYRLIDREGRTIRLDKNCKTVMPPAEFLSRVLMPEKHFFKMNISGILFPRQTLADLGGFVDLKIPWHTERVTWTLLVSRGYCVFEDQPLCNIRLHPGSITSSFESDYLSSIYSDIEARRIFEDILNYIEQRSSAEADFRCLEEARQNLESYMERHMSRSLDRGFLAFLSQPKSQSQIDTLFSKMEELSLPAFPSSRMYAFLSRTPFFLRMPILQVLRYYKIHKWCV